MTFCVPLPPLPKLTCQMDCVRNHQHAEIDCRANHDDCDDVGSGSDCGSYGQPDCVQQW